MERLLGVNALEIVSRIEQVLWRCPRVSAPRLSRRREIVEINRRSPRTSVVTGLNSGADA